MRVAVKVLAVVLLMLLAVRVADRWSRLQRTHICPPDPYGNNAWLYLMVAGDAVDRHHEEHGRYEIRVPDFSEVPKEGRRYAYYLAAAGPLLDLSADEVPPCPECVGVQLDPRLYPKASLYSTYAATGCPLTTAAVPPFEPMPDLGVRNQPGAEAWLFAAAGNINQDPILECWSIASYDRVGRGGKVIHAGQAHLEQWDWKYPGRWQKSLRLVL